MLSQASKRLVDDHVALDALLRDLKEALDARDVNAVHSKLDLFWARLAVHIRAEHLHLFPAISASVRKAAPGRSGTPTQRECEIVIEQLRDDHDFFMHELARAIAILRNLSRTADRETTNDELNLVREAVFEIEKQLMIHNELEENRIYRWTTTILSEQEQSDLAARIESELANRPQRFSPSSWSNQPVLS